MKIISQYTPPTAPALARLKDDLNTTSQAMAELCGLAQGQQWRKYTGGSTPRTLGMHMHFYMAALLTLSDDEVARVVAAMRDQGAELELADGPALGVTLAGDGMDRARDAEWAAIQTAVDALAGARNDDEMWGLHDLVEDRLQRAQDDSLITDRERYEWQDRLDAAQKRWARSR
ncbi:TPA: hypothetical protein ACKP0L_005665 [Pseudomonas putida]